MSKTYYNNRGDNEKIIIKRDEGVKFEMPNRDKYINDISQINYNETESQFPYKTKTH